MSNNTLQVGLGERSYPIYIEDGVLARVGADLAERKIGNRYVIIADDHVARLYGHTLLSSMADAGLSAELVTFPEGEASKNLQLYAELCSRLAGLGLDRKGCLIALGGGVTGDMTGFLAATYMRGIPFVQVPTTLLSQVDSSVGGKTGVDIPEGKNLVGAFYQPKAVYIDTAVLMSLDKSEFIGGMAEVIKYGVIRDADFHVFLEKNIDAILGLEPKIIQEMIHTCCRIKAEVVAEDETEADLRRILNYGHTIGHGVEAASDFTIIHGNGVAMGMVAALRLAVDSGLCRKNDAGRVAALIHSYGLPTEIPAELDRERIKGYLLSDKKTISGRIFFVLPTEIGKVLISDEITTDQIDKVLKPRL
ncbi:MAG: 3-dehydroquinate synthase [Thermodesulfobacteriota bacterium]